MSFRVQSGFRSKTRWLLILCAATAATSAPARSGGHVVPQCVGITLTAAYLAQVTPVEGPGFLLIINNNTDRSIRLVKPFPSSAHWYAQAGTGHWLWRASTGSGGALVNALDEHGPLLAYAPPPGDHPPPEYLTVEAHQHLEVAESMRSSPILRFKPGCERCKNPEDERYRAVLAYAYVPGPTTGSVPGLLPCGLRSSQIVMPPLE